MVSRRTYKTQGVVLKQTPIGEADRVLSIFTPDLGKVRVVARGVRRTKSRLAGHLEPLTQVSISVSRGRTLDVINEAETIRSFRALREDLRRVSEGVYLAELVESFSAEQQPNLAIYDLLLEALEFLERSEDATQAIRCFEMQLLDHSGFGPELYQCVECRSTLEPGGYLFSSAKGGVLCQQCNPLSGEALLPLSLNANKVLRYFQREGLQNAASLDVPPAVLNEIDRLLRTYIRYVLERELKSAEFVEIVARQRSAQDRGSHDGIVPTRG